MADFAAVGINSRFPPNSICLFLSPPIASLRLVGTTTLGTDSPLSNLTPGHRTDGMAPESLKGRWRTAILHLLCRHQSVQR
jgi:hypothetical protein